MNLRSRILLTSVSLVLVPLCILAVLIRSEIAERMTRQHEMRLDTLAGVIREDMAARGARIQTRLRALSGQIADDHRFRAAALDDFEGQRHYLRDFAGGLRRLQGLDLLQIQDADGVILSSGHFPGEMDRREAFLPEQLVAAPDGAALVRARRPEGGFIALAAVDSLRLGARWLRMVGGEEIDRARLARLARGTDLIVSLIYPGRVPDGLEGVTLATRRAHETAGVTDSPGVFSSNSTMEGILEASIMLRDARMIVALPEPRYLNRQVALPFVLGGAGGHYEPAYLMVSESRASLNALLGSLDRWLLLVILASAAGTLLLAVYLAARISRPLGELARKTEAIDLDHLQVSFESRRGDEVGVLARLLGRMTARLQTSTERLRDAERRATLGEIARQVNHDIKNGLTPIRNIVCHLNEVLEREPDAVARVFGERRAVLDSSISYLEALAAKYAKISRRPSRRPCDLGEIAEQVARAMGGRSRIDVRFARRRGLRTVIGDAVDLRRIVENLVRNACESLEPGGGWVDIHLDDAADAGGRPGVKLVVRDSGPGIPPELRDKIFDDFYTTKQSGAGLGLSIVRRLVADFGGTVQLDSPPGEGAGFVVWLPAAEGKQA